MLKYLRDLLLSRIKGIHRLSIVIRNQRLQLILSLLIGLIQPILMLRVLSELVQFLGSILAFKMLRTKDLKVILRARAPKLTPNREIFLALQLSKIIKLQDQLSLQIIIFSRYLFNNLPICEDSLKIQSKLINTN